MQDMVQPLGVLCAAGTGGQAGVRLSLSGVGGWEERAWKTCKGTVGGDRDGVLLGLASLVAGWVESRQV